MASNPFEREHGQIMAVSDRLRAVEQFDLAQCHAALEVPHLQKTVEKKIRARIRKLEKANG